MSKLIAFVLGLLLGFCFSSVIEQHAAAQQVANILPFVSGLILAGIVG